MAAAAAHRQALLRGPRGAARRARHGRGRGPRAGTEVRYEGDDEQFPHIYGPIDPAWVSPRPASIEKGWLTFE
nr:hypothetical protein [Demequina salsinemoris]